MLFSPMKHIPYVNSLGEEHVILELGPQQLHWRSGKSQKQYYAHDQPRKQGAQDSGSVLQLNISDKSGLQSQCSLVEKKSHQHVEGMLQRAQM